MSFLIDLVHNRVLLAAVLSWFLAQGLKMVLDLINGRFTVNRLSGGGGMPSAHSATVCGLTAATAITSGGSSPEFAIALFFAIIVIYDAMGVRYETGQQAKILNRLRVRDAKEGKEEIQEKPLEEKMGHTLPEIAAGCFIGILVGILIGRM